MEGGDVMSSMRTYCPNCKKDVLGIQGLSKGEIVEKCPICGKVLDAARIKER